MEICRHIKVKTPTPSPLKKYALQSKYHSALFYLSDRCYAVAYFDDDDLEMVSFKQGVLTARELHEFSKRQHKEILEEESRIISQENFKIVIPTSVITSAAIAKKLKNLIDRKRLVFLLNVISILIPTMEKRLVIVPATEEELWYPSKFDLPGNRQTLLAYVFSVIKEFHIVPCLSFATSNAVVNTEEGIAHVFMRYNVHKTSPRPNDMGALLELLYTLWYIHTDLKIMVGNVSSVKFVKCEGEKIIIPSRGPLVNGFIYESHCRAVLEDFSEAMIMRDGPLLSYPNPQRINMFNQLKRIQSLLKTRANYDLDLMKIKEDNGDTWVELFHIIFVIDYVDACALFESVLPQKITKKCEKFIKVALAMMHSGKRNKTTFNDLWESILEEFEHLRISNFPSRKTKTDEIYTYNEIFNYCPQLKCLEQ